MRGRVVAAFVVLGTLFAACAARAAEAVAEGEAPGASWTALIISAAAALGILDRLARWAVAHWKRLRVAIRVLREVFAVIEALVQSPEPEDAAAAKAALAIKAAMRAADAARPPAEQAIVTDAAAAAERAARVTGSATQTLARPEASKGRRFLNGAGKVAGFLVGFLPLVGRLVP